MVTATRIMVSTPRTAMSASDDGEVVATSTIGTARLTISGAIRIVS